MASQYIARHHRDQKIRYIKVKLPENPQDELNQQRSLYWFNQRERKRVFGGPESLHATETYTTVDSLPNHSWEMDKQLLESLGPLTIETADSAWALYRMIGYDLRTERYTATQEET